MNSREVIERCGSYFSNTDEIRLALVFGSAGRGKLESHSDVDVAIAGRAPLAKSKLADVRNDLARLLGREIDLIDLNLAEGLILHRAVTEGVRVKSDAALFERFLTKALDFQEDFHPLVRRMREEKVNRFIHGQ